MMLGSSTGQWWRWLDGEVAANSREVQRWVAHVAGAISWKGGDENEGFADSCRLLKGKLVREKSAVMAGKGSKNSGIKGSKI